MVQWLGLDCVAAKDVGSIPSPGTKILEAIARSPSSSPKDVSRDEVVLGIGMGSIPCDWGP